MRRGECLVRRQLGRLESPPYDLRAWNKGMLFPGSGQVRVAKSLPETLPRQQSYEHPECVGHGSFAAGFPGVFRLIYQPNRGVHKWDGITVSDAGPGSLSAFLHVPHAPFRDGRSPAPK